MYEHTLHCERKHFFRYCFQAFSTERRSKRHFKDCLEITGKQRIIMPTTKPYTNKYQKYIACSHGYKLICVDDKFSKPLKTCLAKM